MHCAESAYQFSITAFLHIVEINGLTNLHAQIQYPVSNGELAYATCPLSWCIMVGAITPQVFQLRQLLAFCLECDPDVATTVRRLSMISLTLVFKDIIPRYV